MSRFMETSYAPINRSAYQLAAEATDAYEGARKAVRRFINAPRAEEVIFTKNATEALNLVACSRGGGPTCAPATWSCSPQMEHHANIVPWQMLAAERGIELRWVPLTVDGQLDLTNLAALLDGAKAFGFTAMSNVLGTITPVRQLCDAAHAAGALAVVDACQYVPHNVTDVQAWDADFVAFSSHKMCGPSGIGVLWGREALLDAMPPFLGGGNMIADVRLDGFTRAELPAKFEAGTPPITEAIGLGAAIDFLDDLGMINVRRHEMEIAAYAMAMTLPASPTMPRSTGTILLIELRSISTWTSWRAGEGVQPAGDPVVETRAQADDQVGLVHRHIGFIGAVHPQHPQPLHRRSPERHRAPSGSR